MKIKEFIGSTVLDKNANVVGKVENVDFNTETGKEIYTTVFTGCENLEHVVIGSGVKKLNEELIFI